ncbi:hypothetical protein J7L13_02585, partial [bacterium]|nr:hypothetical protein [bacterium]
QAVGQPDKAVFVDTAGGLFFIWTSSGDYYLYRLADKSLIEAPKAGAFSWPENPFELLSYRNRIYFRNQEGLWRLRYTQAGFSAPEEVVGEEVAQAKSATIDGAVYFLFERGELKKFLGTSWQEDFSLKVPFYLSLASAEKIYTSEDIGVLIFWLPSERKVVLFAKSGEFKEQMVLPEEWGQVKDILALPTGELYVLAGEKVYRLQY